MKTIVKRKNKIKIKVKIFVFFCLLLLNSTAQAKSPSELIVEIVDKASSILSGNATDDEKIIQLNEVACASALKPMIGSKTLKFSINCIKVTNVINGIICGIIICIVC